jgi:hypothetical protein
MADRQGSTTKGILAVIGAGAAALGAFIVSRLSEELGKMSGEYLGISLFVPLLVVFGCCWLARKLLPENLKVLSIGIGIVSAQVVLHIFAGLYFGVLPRLLIDIAILTAGLTWLIMRPSIWPICALIAFEVYAVGSNLLVLAQVPNTAVVFKGVLSFMVIRLAAIFFLVLGYRALKPISSTAVSKSSIPSASEASGSAA